MRNVWNSRSWVLDRVTAEGMDLKFVSSSLQNEREVVLRAIYNDKKAFQFASKELRCDKEFIYHSVGTMSTPSFLEFMDDSLKDDIDFISKLICTKGCCIRWASERLRKRWPLVIMAIKSNIISIHDIDTSVWAHSEHVDIALQFRPEWSIYLRRD